MCGPPRLLTLTTLLPAYNSAGIRGGLALGTKGGPFSSTSRCIGGRYSHEQSFETYDPDLPPATTLFWLLDAHEPMGEAVASVDAGLAHFLEHVVDMNRTAVLLVGDHGSHVGLYPTTTEAGYVEKSNPMSVLTLPGWYTSHDEAVALHGNEQRLITHFDMYATLRHIVDRSLDDDTAPGKSKKEARAPACPSGGVFKGRDLFTNITDMAWADHHIQSSCLCTQCKIFCSGDDCAYPSADVATVENGTAEKPAALPGTTLIHPTVIGPTGGYIVATLLATAFLFAFCAREAINRYSYCCFFSYTYAYKAA